VGSSGHDVVELSGRFKMSEQTAVVVEKIATAPPPFDWFMILATEVRGYGRLEGMRYPIAEIRIDRGCKLQVACRAWYRKAVE
jgi:hypothetical protein